MFSMDCYFRQNWKDVRLSFQPYRNISELRPSIKMLDEIWKPDTYFLNGQGSYLHTITYHNKLFRIQTDGQILYSQRSVLLNYHFLIIYKQEKKHDWIIYYIVSWYRALRAAL